MKMYRFKEKLPLLGTNVLVFNEQASMVGICRFDLKARDTVLNSEGCNYHPQEYYSDDSEEDNEYDLRWADYWCYPSSIKLPKNKVKS